MRTLRPSLLSFSAFLLLRVMGAGQVETTAAEVSPPEVVRTVDPILPPDLRNTEGEVRIELEVSPRGRVSSATIVEASHPRLGLAAREAVLQWRFLPAMQDGHPVSFTLVQPFHFKRDMVVSESLAKVDRIPRVRHREAPKVPIALENAEGYCDLLLLVDALGNVIEAQVRRCSNPALEDPTLEAARHWKFDPARKSGEPVPCQVLLPFRFGG